MSYIIMDKYISEFMYPRALSSDGKDSVKGRNLARDTARKLKKIDTRRRVVAAYKHVSASSSTSIVANTLNITAETSLHSPKIRQM